MHRSRRALMAVVVLVACFSAGAAQAVPNFARKYDLNCNVCHTREPRLNPFGQRFQENGYQLPGTEDGGVTKKQMFGGLALDSVSNMFSARIRADIQQASFKEKTEATDDVDFVVPNIMNLFVAGTANKNVGYFFEVEYAPGEGHAELIFERIFVVFSNIGNRHQALNVKIGEFDPSAYFAFPTHRQQMNPIFPDAHTEDFPPEINRIPILPLAFSSKMFGLTTGPHNEEEDGFSILPFEPYLYNSPAALGIAVYGRPAGENFFYQIGLVQEETAEDEPETRYDYHVTLRYDLPMGKNRASQIAGFYYHAPDAARPTLAPMGNLFFAPTVDWDRYGIGARMQHKMIDVYATVIWDEIDQPMFAGPPLSLSKWDTDGMGASLEIDWLKSEKWLFAARYDYMDPGGLVELPGPLQMGDPAINQEASFIGLIAKHYPATNIGLYARCHFNLNGSVELPRALGGGIHPARNLESVIAVGIDMAF